VNETDLPETPRKPVTDEYHRVRIVDDYRWLEEASDVAVKEWTVRQNRHAHAVLDQISCLEAVRARVKELMTASPAYRALCYREGRLFALKSEPPKNQPILIALESTGDLGSQQVIVDPNKLDPKGALSIDFYVPSLDGRLVAVSLSESGTEEGAVHIYDVAVGKKLPDVIPRVTYMGGSVAWNSDGTGFYYTRYPSPRERPEQDLRFYEQIYFHKLGTPASEDSYSIGKEFPKIAEIQLQASEDGNHILATVANGDGGDYSHYLLDQRGTWTQITRFDDKVTAATFGPDNCLYMVSHKDAPKGKVLRLPVGSPELRLAEPIISETDAAIEGFQYTPNGTFTKLVATPSRLYLGCVVGGPSELRIFDLEGHLPGVVPIPPISSIGQMLAIGGDVILFEAQSFTDPPAWCRYNPSSGDVERTRLCESSPVDFRDKEVIREFATSKDGTKVPLSIIQRKGTTLNGKNPTLLTGYGGFASSFKPVFRVDSRAWLEQGGVCAVANLRGGNEYGEGWHEAGKLTKKQNVFDDFIACARFLIDAGYTSPERLAIEGESNGGLLMGAALTQHPELFRAVVSHVGIYDMVRCELNPNGVYNTTEFGTVKEPEQFRAIYAYSPYHHVQDGTAYPAVFFLAGENDPRVSPANSRKMTARLQAATSSGLPVLLSPSSSSGHGFDSPLSEKIAQRADVYAFLFHYLNVDYKAVS
jgi:prolyl oligopeptidase